MDEKTVKSRFKQVCVFCGSSTSKKNCYRDAALDLGEELVSRRLNLVYGGGSVGLMGLVSQTVHRGVGHKQVGGGETFEADMHQRKAEMARHSDCFIALPVRQKGWEVGNFLSPPSLQVLGFNLRERVISVAMNLLYSSLDSVSLLTRLATTFYVFFSEVDDSESPIFPSTINSE
ncbi:hypothetical protein NE237_001853 [Protea cynaroides]|uniref:Cytokinin riboside 5'-monophosphate phosphoribohydrolase n=1 Tax=Protea cynaroides TaxID=273540 RepID=A0A9Q0KTW1_9MAGN|nr:hypothetical protein NE237_001853 [Protea cynaroides]